MSDECDVGRVLCWTSVMSDDCDVGRVGCQASGV